MLHRNSFIPVFSCLLSGLAWWSVQVQPPSSSHSFDMSADRADLSKLESELGSKSPVATRRDLIETLDRLVTYEHYYHSVHGRFTKQLTRTGFSLPRPVLDVYEIRIAEATADHLLVSAFSEVGGKVQDLVSIDQAFTLHANFEVPPPRKEYLKSRAMKYLRQLQNAPEGQNIAEEGIFKGYFKYDVQINSQKKRVVSAVGVRSPIKGIRLDLDQVDAERVAQVGQGESPQADSGTVLISDVLSGVIHGTMPNGMMPQGTTSKDKDAAHEREAPSSETHSEPPLETHLAQKIFHEEMGRYANNWAELLGVAHFQFAAQGGATPKGQKKERSPANQQVTSHRTGKLLEIEPIQSEEASQ